MRAAQNMSPGQVALRTKTHGMRARAWWVMRRHGHFTLAQLLATVAEGGERDAASNLRRYLQSLVKAGIVAVEGRAAPEHLTSNGCLRYRLVVDCGRHAPVWRASNNSVFDPNGEVTYGL